MSIPASQSSTHRAGHPAEPPPPAGPISFQGLFWTTDASMYPRRLSIHNRGLWMHVVSGIAAIALAIWYFGSFDISLHSSPEAVLQCMIFWIAAEPLAWIWGGWRAAATLRRWRLQGRIDELRLTPTRPFVLSQLIVRESLDGISVLLILAAVGWIGIPLISNNDVASMYLAGVLLVIGQIGITVHVAAWSMALMRLGSTTPRGGWGGHFLAGLSLSFWFGLGTFATFACALFAAFEPNSIPEPVVAAIGLAAALWIQWAYVWLKILAARAFAAQLERAIWPEIDA